MALASERHFSEGVHNLNIRIIIPMFLDPKDLKIQLCQSVSQSRLLLKCRHEIQPQILNPNTITKSNHKQNYWVTLHPKDT